MKNRIISLFLLIFPLIVQGQYQVRPLLDSTAACAYHKSMGETRYFAPDSPKKHDGKVDLEFFYIVEKMPNPEINIDVLQTSLEKEVLLNKQEKILSRKMYFQCIVNCKGKAGDFQTIDCPGKFSNICCQVFDVASKKLSSWEPGKQRNQDVDVLVVIKVIYDEGKFNVVAPYY